MSREKRPEDGAAPERHPLTEIRIHVPADLAIAWQRCSWVLVQDRGQGRLESMEEMVRDFLVKHGC